MAWLFEWAQTAAGAVGRQARMFTQLEANARVKPIHLLVEWKRISSNHYYSRKW